MIRSGSTLQYNVVCDGLSLVGVSYECLGYYDSKEIDEKRQELVKRARAADKFYVLKTHEYIPFLNDLAGVKIVYSYRDIRDVCSSAMEKFSIDFEKAIIYLDDAVKVEGQIGFAKCSVISQKYEEIISDRSKFVRELLSFIGCATDPEVLEVVLDKNSLESGVAKMNRLSLIEITRDKLYFALVNSGAGKFLRMLGVSEFFVRRWKKKLEPGGGRRSGLLHSGHISKAMGKAGRFAASLSDDEIVFLNARYRRWLFEHGYLG